MLRSLLAALPDKDRVEIDGGRFEAGSYDRFVCSAARPRNGTQPWQQ